MMKSATELSLADFFYSDSDNPFTPATDYIEWRRVGKWATDLYEPQLYGPAVPRVKIQRAGLERQVVNLASYNYMGMAANAEVVRAGQEALQAYGTGACGSPLLSGLTDLHRRLEDALSTLLNREATMLYNSGFAGAMGALAGVLRKGDVAILDTKCHLSLIAGANLARARVQFFDHNDPSSLDEQLKKASGKRRVVVVEGVYSMDGDIADLPALLPVTEQHGVGIFIDEAHSMLVMGEHGRGAIEHYGVADRIDLVFGTFSKSFAHVGGFVSGKRDIIDYIRYYSHPYGFSCALPPAVVAGLLKVLEINQRPAPRRAALWDAVPRLRDRLTELGIGSGHRFAVAWLFGALGIVSCGDILRRKLRDNTHYFRTCLLEMGLDIGQSESQVIPIIVGSDRELLYDLCREMTEKGLFLPPVDYPSVPEGELRFRAAITAAHSRQDLDEALQIIKDTIVCKLR